MSTDQRKKIVSISQELGGIEVVSQADILFPCNMFEITLPVMPKPELNIFEETVLRLVHFGLSDKEQLAETTTLEQELIAFILNRLQNIGYLNKHNKLTDKGNFYFEKNTEANELRRIKMFVELNTGKILPMIYPQDVTLSYQEGFNKEEKKIKFSTGTTGKSKPVWAYFFDEDRDLGYKNITVKDVLQVVRMYEKKRRQYKILRREEDSFTSVLGNRGSILINETPELVYLHCTAVVQKTSGEVFVSDGFGFGFSQMFRETLQNERPDLIQTIKRQGEQHKIGEEEKYEEMMKVTGFGKTIYQYPEIADRIRQTSRKWKDINCEETGTNAENRRNEVINEYSKLMYDLLEWTFRYVVNETHTQPMPTYIFQNTEKGKEFLNQCAKKIGIATLPNIVVSAGSIKNCEEGSQANMLPLLAILIYDASIDSQRKHPLFQLVRSENEVLFDSRKKTDGKQQSEWEKKRDFVDFIDSLKRLRDAAAHGDKKVLRKEEVAVIRNTTYRIVKDILPVLKGEKVEVKVLTTEKDINQSFLKAQNILEAYFGYNEYRMIDKQTQDLLEKIEMTLKESTPVLSDVIINLASIMQRTLFLQYKNGIQKLFDKNINYKKLALDKAAGFDLQEGNFGAGINTVQQRHIEAAVKGGNQTIGANLYAFLVNIEESKLQEIAVRIPFLIILVEKLAKLRGHGNTDKTFQREVVDDLKNKVYQTIKTLQEI
ncbi:MAG: hypothetical protein LBT09_08625 [Planctomycetaceae bacterium]|jgi:hypothetical protein|nr:hypothetical protein [Planctomycetaceae bacterium]